MIVEVISPFNPSNDYVPKLKLLISIIKEHSTHLLGVLFY